MNRIAAIPTGRRAQPPTRVAAARCSFVEDLNWPGPPPVPDKKAPRPTQVWVPGPDGEWQGSVPTLQ